MNQNNEGYKFVTSFSLYKTSLIKKGDNHSFYLKTKKQTTSVTLTDKLLFTCWMIENK